MLFYFCLLFHVYAETRPETLGLLIELDRQLKQAFDTEQFVRNTKIIEFQAYVIYSDLVNLRAVDHRVATKFLLKCKGVLP